MAKAIGERAENNGSLKTIVVILFIILLVPVITLGIMYTVSDTFRQTTQDVMQHAPGPIGAYFETLPTEEEKETIKREIAQHYIDMDPDRIVDKLLVVRGEDRSLYNDLVRKMNRENPRKMSEVQDQLQLALVQDDTLLWMLEEVEQERQAESSALSDYLEGLTTPEAISEMERMTDAGLIEPEDLGILFQQLDRELAAEYMRYLPDSLINHLRNQLPSSMMEEIEKELTRQLSDERDLIQQARVYAQKGLDEVIPLLTTEEEHDLDELAVIFHQLPLPQGGRILARAEDEAFARELYKEMTILEELVPDREGTTERLTEAVVFFRRYHRKVNELAEVYQQMDMEELAPLVERMLVSNTMVKQHTLSPEEQLVRTEEQLVLDVLNRMRPALVSDLLSHVSTPRAVLLSQKLFGE